MWISGSKLNVMLNADKTKKYHFSSCSEFQNYIFKKQVTFLKSDYFGGHLDIFHHLGFYYTKTFKLLIIFLSYGR